MTRSACLLMGVALVVSACAVEDVGAPESTSPDDGGSGAVLNAEVYGALLTSLGERVIVETYTEFLAASEELVTSTAAYGASPSAETRDGARVAFAHAMDLWQRAEVLQVGPAGPMTTVLGGEDIRDEIYSWPSVNACRVDQEVLERAYVDAVVFADELTNVRGLDAIEYLLYPPETGNGCKASSTINAEGAWEVLVESGQVEAQRAAYSATLATLLSAEASGLLNLWTQGDDAFQGALASAGDGSEIYGTAQDGLNAISDAMFYVEKTTKDMKLAMPAGLSDCEEDICPGDLESQHAHRSADNVLQNIIAVQALFLGTYGDPAEAPGFDDLLHEMGNGALADLMTAKISTARELAASIDGSLHELLESDPKSVTDVHAALKAFTDLMKTEFVSTLDLALPMSAAGDND